MKKIFSLVILSVASISVVAQKNTEDLLDTIGGVAEARWGGQGSFRTISRCVGGNSQNQPVLRGTEISGRNNDPTSVNQACSNWASVANSIYSFKDIKVRLRSTRSHFMFTEGTFEETARLEYFLSNRTGDTFAGLYIVEDKESGFFSQGAFASPIRSSLKSGVFYYGGIFSHNTTKINKDKFLMVDFEKNEINIKVKFIDKSDNEITLENSAPIKFRPDTGDFTGILDKVVIRPQFVDSRRVTNSRARISGIIGGKDAEVLSAVMHDGGPFLEFVLVKRED
jgi:hypothetical protein